MSTSISYDGGQPIIPDLVNIASAAASSAPRTVTHEILDGPPVYTLRSAGPLAGTLELTFIGETAARDCLDAHGLAAVFTMTSDDRALFNGKYVVTDTVALILEQDTASHWTVTIPYTVVT